MDIGQTVPEFDVSEWVGSPQLLADLRGRVVLVETFQMLCPGCVSHGLPQAQRVQRAFPEVVVIGLHTVFEHHDAMTPVSLRAFMHVYRINFPVGIDRHDGDPTPVTMRRYALRGTPSTLLIDRQGKLSLSAFGAVDDLQLGGQLGRLLADPVGTVEQPPEAIPTVQPADTCQPGVGCT